MIDWLRKGLEENEILETQIDENTRELNALKLDLTEGKYCLIFPNDYMINKHVNVKLVVY